MKVITIGDGFIASHFPYPIVKDRIIADYNYINSFLNEHKPDVIINCIGFCGGKNIDGCEQDKQRTFNTNTILPIMLASECEKRDIRFIQIGSGCIFYGLSPNLICVDRFFADSGWREQDITNPLSTYSKSKYACDLALQTLKNTTILRIRMPISGKRSPRNLISKLINYNMVVEEPNSITPVSELSRSIDFVIHKGIVGIRHIASPKPITHSRILNEYKKYVPEHVFTSITPDELDNITAAKRSNCILDSSKIISEGFEFQDVDDLLADCMKDFTDQLRK